MKIHRSVYLLVAVAAFGVAALGASSVAQARDVAWSVGIASPGVQIGIGNAPQAFYRQPAYVPPAVYYGQPQVVYSQPQVIYPQPQVVYAQPQVIYAPQPYYARAVYGPTIYYRGGGPHHPRWHNDRWDHNGHR